MRTVVVPDGYKAILITDQLAAHYTDWTALTAPAPYTHIEAKASPTKDPLVLDVQTRYCPHQMLEVQTPRKRLQREPHWNEHGRNTYKWPRRPMGLYAEAIPLTAQTWPG